MLRPSLMAPEAEIQFLDDHVAVLGGPARPGQRVGGASEVERYAEARAPRHRKRRGTRPVSGVFGNGGVQSSTLIHPWMRTTVVVH